MSLCMKLNPNHTLITFKEDIDLYNHFTQIKQYYEEAYVSEEYQELFNLFIIEGFSMKEVRTLWLKMWRVRKETKDDYKAKPERRRQDNKSTINYGSGSGGRGKIRYPKKVRKTAWKRFYKLFPHLDPENKDNQASVPYLTKEVKKLLS